MSRIGQWKITNTGNCKCIAEGGGYVMARTRGNPPTCFPVLIWDEMWDGLPSDVDNLIGGDDKEPEVKQ